MKINRGIWYVIAAAVLWAASGVMGQFVYVRGVVGPTFVVTVRFLLSGVLLLMLSGYKTYKCNCENYQHKSILDIFKTKRSLYQLCFFAIFGAGMVQLSYFYAIYESNAATATFLQYVSPAIVMIYMTIKKRTLPTWNQGICTVLAIVGVFLIATHGSVTNLALTPAALIWGLISASSLAVYTVYPGELIREYTIENVLGWCTIISGIISLVVLKPWVGYAGINGMEILCLIALVIFGTMIGFSIYSKGVLLIGETRASVIATLEPLSSALLSFVLLGVEFVAMDYVGFACILLITFLASREKS